MDFKIALEIEIKHMVDEFRDLLTYVNEYSTLFVFRIKHANLNI